MMDMFKKIDAKTTGIFAVGVLLGTAGVKLLSSRDARKVYTHGTAAALRAKESIMKTVTNIQENAEDIYAEAKQINEERAAEEMEFEDESEEDAVFQDESDFMETADADTESTAEQHV